MVDMKQQSSRQKNLRIAIGLVLVAGFLVQSHRVFTDQDAGVASPASSVASSGSGVVYAEEAPAIELEVESLEALAARDPIEFFEKAIRRYDRVVRDYTCTFTKQERLEGRLGEQQVMRAMFRDKPYSIRLEWIENADKCDRVLYVKDRWIEEGQQMAVVEPGAIARLFVSYVMRPIHGKDAQRSSRRTVDQFGLRNVLELTLKYVKMSEKKDVADFKYVGTGEVKSRPTLVFERRLPYSGTDGIWPDRLLVVHIDREWMFPTLCLCYADEERKVLLGKYMITDLKINPTLADSTFTKQGMGL
jgi:hypothetical protein